MRKGALLTTAIIVLWSVSFASGAENPIVFKRSFDGIRNNNVFTAFAKKQEEVIVFPGDGYDVIPNLYFLNKQGKIVGQFDPWAQQSTAKIISTGEPASDPVVLNDILVYLDTACNLFVIDLKTNKLLWNYRGIRPSTQSRPAIYNNHVYSVTGDGSIHAFDITTGKEIWNYRAITVISSDLFATKEGVLAGCSDGTLYCFDPFTGKVEWNECISGNDHGGFTDFYEKEGKLYFLDSYKSFHCLNIKDGQELYNTSITLSEDEKMEFNSFASTFNPADFIGDYWTKAYSLESGDGKFYWISLNGAYVVCQDETDGKTLWKKMMNDFVMYPTYYKGYVITGSLSGKLYILDAETRAKKTQFDFEGAMWSKPIIDDDVIYFVSITPGEGSRKKRSILYAVDLNKILENGNNLDAINGGEMSLEN